MVSFRQGAAVGLVICLGACTKSKSGSEPKLAAQVEPGALTKQAQPGTFTYAPALNGRHRETMRREAEMSIPGSPMRDAEKWTMDWDVVTNREGPHYKRSLTLVGLKINVNGADALRGDEIKKSRVTIDIITDEDSNVVDVRGTEELSKAITKLGASEAQPALRRIFSPQRLRALVTERSVEQHADFVGRPTLVGSEWKAQDADTGQSKQVLVVAEERCGAAYCLRVRRQYDIDRKALFDEISEKVAAYVKSQGGDPNKIKLVGTDVNLEDSVLIDPATMDYHAARFNQSATIRIAGPNGELPISLQLLRETDYKY